MLQNGPPFTNGAAKHPNIPKAQARHFRMGKQDEFGVLWKLVFFGAEI